MTNQEGQGACRRVERRILGGLLVDLTIRVRVLIDRANEYREVGTLTPLIQGLDFEVL